MFSKIPPKPTSERTVTADELLAAMLADGIPEEKAELQSTGAKGLGSSSVLCEGILYRIVKEKKPDVS